MNTVTLKIEEVIVLLAAVRKMTRKGANALNIPSPIVDGLGGQYEAVIDWTRRKVVLLSMEGAFAPGERVQHRREFDPETLTSLEVPWQPTSTNVQEDIKPSASSGSTRAKGFRPPSVVPAGGGRGA